MCIYKWFEFNTKGKKNYYKLREKISVTYKNIS